MVGGYGSGSYIFVITNGKEPVEVVAVAICGNSLEPVA